MDPLSVENPPTRELIDQMPGAVMLEFGASWCGWCQAAQPAIEEALSRQPEVRHIKVEDGRGRPLGRSFGVKLWPTLVFLSNGREVDRLVRPASADAISAALERISKG